ncbi:hypothetical protein [Stenotrophomonas virus Jojan60]|nr:hypothetical protein [Stenotrophomonas virus Jojan60]
MILEVSQSLGGFLGKARAFLALVQDNGLDFEKPLHVSDGVHHPAQEGVRYVAGSEQEIGPIRRNSRPTVGQLPDRF